MRLYAFSRAMTGITFLLLLAGALVTSTGSGLAVPDWPLAYGQFFPPMVGGILFEHGHRMIAAAVAALTLVLCIWLLMQEKRRWVRRLGLAALGAVCLQALLGGLTVLLRLPPPVSIAHAGLAELFLGVIVSISVVSSPAWNQGYPNEISAQQAMPLRMLAVTATLAVYVQILLGAMVRHTHWGIGLHVVGALIALWFVGRLSYFINTDCRDIPALRKPAMAAVHTLGAQLVLGPLAWIEKIKDASATQHSVARVVFATAHLAMGALLFALCVLLTWRIFKATEKTALAA